MTFREKYHEDFQKCGKKDPAKPYCPSMFDYEEYGKCKLDFMSCDECWDREIPEDVQK